MRSKEIKNGKPVITEKLFQEQVRKAALITGWLYYHTFNAYRSPEGFPDCVLIHPKKKRLIIGELKSETGEPSAKQNVWLSAWAEIPCAEVWLLRPSMFDQFWKELNR